LTKCDDVTDLDLESGGAMDSDVGVSLFVTIILPDPVKVISSDDNGAVHLVRDTNTPKNATTNAHIASKWALVINKGSFDCFLWCLKSEANVLVITLTSFDIFGQHAMISGKKDGGLLLKSSFGLDVNVITRTLALDFLKTPKEAIEGTFIDHKCPFTGNVSIRGRILRGVCVSNKMNRTIVIRRDYLHWVKKYNRYEKRHTNIAVHCSPAFKVKIGDIITIGQCRPLSKTVRFNVLSVEESSLAQTLQKKKQFRVF